MNTPSRYQLLPRLTKEEYAALEADIKERGVLVPVEKDTEGNILDGHHRAEIAERLGLDYPEIIREFTTEEEKREHVIKINLVRRHLDPIRWGLAFKQLCQEKGIEGRRKDHAGRPTDNALTVKALSEELGVPYDTARNRVKKAESYEALPEPLQILVADDKISLSTATLYHQFLPAEQIKRMWHTYKHNAETKFGRQLNLPF